VCNVQHAHGRTLLEQNATKTAGAVDVPACVRAACAMGGGPSVRHRTDKGGLPTWELTDPDTPTLAWVERVDSDGRTFYENTVSGATLSEVRVAVTAAFCCLLLPAASCCCLLRAAAAVAAAAAAA
jgi:hypothetical protein